MKEYNFPIFQLSDKYINIIKEGNLSYAVDSANDRYLIDNKNLKGDTIGSRRLRVVDKASLAKFTKAIFSLEYLILNARSNVYYVDNLGKVVTYKRKIRAMLKSYKLLSSTKHGLILKDYGVFKTPFKPDKGNQYINILHIPNIGDIIHSSSKEAIIPTWRLV